MDIDPVPVLRTRRGGGGDAEGRAPDTLLGDLHSRGGDPDSRGVQAEGKGGGTSLRLRPFLAHPLYNIASHSAYTWFAICIHLV
jgi:hypothetical protein